jgi:nucleoside-diphosphate-sugar epimerase
MHILITGAGSFIGKHATIALARAGMHITASFRSDNAAVGALRRAVPDVDFVRLDLASNEDVLSLPKSVEAIIHIAGVSLARGTTVEEMLACNVIGTQNLIAYASRIKVPRVVITSTLSIYGDVLENVITEATPIRDPDVYGASKYLAERLFAAESKWLPCVAIRLPGVLGKGAHRAWVPTLLEQAKRNETITVYNPQSSFNNATHVDDLNDLFLKLLKQPWSGFHAFPIGAAGEVSIKGLAQRVIRSSGSRSDIVVGHTQKPSFTISSKYAIQNFDYSPMDIEAMLERYVSECD